MNVEELKKLKEEIENQNKYAVVSEISTEAFINAGEPISANEILEKENTAEFVKQCENLIETAVINLAMNGIPFDQLVISSNVGFFCRPDYIEEWKKYEPENDITEEKWNVLTSKLESKILPDVVPVSFSLNPYFTGTEECEIDTYMAKAGLKSKDLHLEDVTGIVNWEKFIIQMQSLGYNIEFTEYDNGVSFKDYIEVAKQNGWDTFINITADLSKTKKSTTSKM